MSDAATKVLPVGWQLCKLGDVMRLKNGYAFKSKDYADSGIPLVRISDIKDGEVVIDKAVYIPDDLANEDFLVEPGDLLIAMSGATTGKTGVFKGVDPVLQNQRVGNFKIIDETAVNKRYRDYYISSLRKDIEKAAYGGAQPNISSKGIESFPFPLAPPEQQKRIVAKIEELFSHIDAGIEALKKAKQLLKQYRQSVLKAAVTGELTKEWRKANKAKLEPASQLIERILKERRQRWEEQQLKQFKAKGKMPKDDKWKDKYKPASECDSEYTSSFLCGINFPDNWGLCSLELLSNLITDGDHNPPKRIDSGIPHLTARNIVDGNLDFTNCTYLSEEGFEQTRNRYDPKPGDVLITCVGTIGRIAIVPENVVFSADRNLAVTRLNVNYALPKYIEILLNSPGIQKLLLAGSGSTAQPHIYLRQIRALPIPLPTVSEQIKIIESVEDKMNSFNRLLNELDHQLIKSEKNKQSILATSFSGEL